MRFSKEKYKEISSHLRRALVINPNATIPDLIGELKNVYGHEFDKNFVCKLKNKIHQERFHRLERRAIETDLAELEDVVDICSEELWKIIDSSACPRDLINAARTLLRMKSDLFEAKLNSGVYKAKSNKTEALSKEDQELLERAINFAVGRAKKD